MGKYSKYQRPPFEKKNIEHPVWRGIGCLLMVIVPLISFAASVLLVEYGVKQAWPIPPELTGYLQFPAWVLQTPVLSFVARPIAQFPNLGAVALLFIIMLVMFSGIFTTAYAIARRITGPSRFSRVDAPPPKYKPKVYKR